MVSGQTKELLHLTNVVLNVFWLAYIFSGFSGLVNRYLPLSRPRPPVLNVIWYWSKWPAAVFVFAPISIKILTSESIGMWDYFALLLSCWLWWICRNSGDDDDYKKLKKKKLKEKVVQFGRKLVILPEPA